jgi:sulfite reductase alpha subunit-like flavoprotein
VCALQSCVLGRDTPHGHSQPVTLSVNDKCHMSVLILYATETGTSQAIADFIALHLRRIHLKARICDVGNYPPSSLINELLTIFVVSTTGTGLAPPSMAALWSALLRSDLPADIFDETSFAVFGLGDSAYERFCWPAKKLARRMAALGAKEICERGEGDEQHPCG